MPKYKVLRDTLNPNTGRIHKEGEELEIEWPVFGSKKTSSEPKTLGANLELIEEAPRKPSKSAADLT